MVSIVNIDTKKELKNRVKNLYIKENTDFYIDDPSIFGNNNSKFASDILEGEKITVTNHPKRSYFAVITKQNGVLKVL